MIRLDLQNGLVKIAGFLHLSHLMMGNSLLKSRLNFLFQGR